MKQNVIEQLRKAIRDSGEKQMSICDATGMQQSNLSRFLTTGKGLSVETFASLCDHFKLKLTPKK